MRAQRRMFRQSSRSSSVEQPTTGTCWMRKSGSLVRHEPSSSSIRAASATAAAREPWWCRSSSSARSATEGILTLGKRTPAIAWSTMKDSTASSFLEKSSTDSAPVFAVDADVLSCCPPPPPDAASSSFTPTPRSGSVSPLPASVHIASDFADHFVTPPVCVIPRNCKVYVALLRSWSMWTTHRFSEVIRTANDRASNLTGLDARPQPSHRRTS
mmetsp:Transcript_52741/g.153374  ORF Transcript_52741/g.153374 Transcript_52741/m.153374 type:complete len:214 (-) Transcript_52741:746-1387(-)